MVVQYSEGPDGALCRCPCGEGAMEVVLTGVVDWERMETQQGQAAL